MTDTLIQVDLTPVSYTHLDVYKRQALTCGDEFPAYPEHRMARR